MIFDLSALSYRNTKEKRVKGSLILLPLLLKLLFVIRKDTRWKVQKYQSPFLVFPAQSVWK